MEPEKAQENELNKLKKHSLVVADTGDFTLIEKYHPEDSTTNPSLILQVSKRPEFQHILEDSISFGLKHFEAYCGQKGADAKPVEWTQLNEQQKEELIDLIFDHICVSFGVRILQKVKGYVSTEVDASLSFHTNETVKRAKRILELYKHEGVDVERVLIKIASTWEGIKAGEILKGLGIKTNMTLIFHMVQAVACAHHGLFLISPFIGRLLDWSKKEFGKTYDNPADDPGVIFVTEIFNYYISHGIKTIIMGASFRNIGEIKELAGCHRLTISPALLDTLHDSYGEVPLKLDPKVAATLKVKDIDASEQNFRHQMNRSKLATDLLSNGIRIFEDAGTELKHIIKKRLIDLYEAKK